MSADSNEPGSTKPYLVRAIHEWCVDNGFTPYLAVVVDQNTRVPREHVKDGEIVLNIGPLATHKLMIGNDDVQFQARFGGVARDLYVPMTAVAAIFARENGEGLQFQVSREGLGTIEAVDATPVREPVGDPPRGDPPAPAGSTRPSLRVIK